jgi:HK97 family phage portal protein
MPLRIYKNENSENGKHNSKTAAVSHPLYRLLYLSPNPEMTSFVFFETLMSHILLWGNAYAQIIRNGNGHPVGLYPLLPDKMTVERDKKSEVITYIYRSDNGEVKLPEWEVLHIPGLGFDGLIGYSPIEIQRQALGLAKTVDSYGGKFFANGANPGGVIEFPGTVKDIKRMRESWNTVHQGAGNAGKIAILEDGAKFSAISMSPEQAQFLEMRKFSVVEIARIFRVPPHLIGDLERSTFSNIEQQALDFMTKTMLPWVTRWEQGLMRSLLLPSEQGKYYIKFSMDSQLRGEYKTRMEGYAIGINNGFLSPNDVRELEDMNPIGEAGDKYIVNGNSIPLELVGRQYVEKEEMEGNEE